MNRTDRPDYRSGEKDFWNFVNVCSVFLAFISLYTTAEGMNHFFFKNDRAHGYLISLAIQGILLSLNLRLPKYLAGKAMPAKCCAAGLYLFTVLWSSGFSYIFMSNVIYEDTWMKDAQIEMSGLYQKGRQELALRAGEAMRTAVNNVLGDVTVFKARAVQNDAADSVQIPADRYEEYASLFAEDVQMQQIIGRMKAGENASGEIAAASIVLTDRESALLEQKEIISEELAQTQERLTGIDAQRTALITQRARVAAGSDAHNSYTASIEEKTSDMETVREKQKEYEIQKKEIEEQLKAVSALASITGMEQNSGLGQTEQEFSGILAQLGSTEPDIERIGEMTDRIYATLIATTKTGQDSAEYGALLQDYLKLRTDLSEAAEIRGTLRWLEQEDTAVKNTEQLVKADMSEQALAQWREEWNQSLTQLKSMVLLIPEAETQTAGAAETLKTAERGVGEWEKGREKLLNSLTWMQRNYLLELNEVEKAGNYLFGTYPAMAWFSLLFAVYLDTAPMLLAVFKYRGGKSVEEKVEKKRSPLFKAALGTAVMGVVILNSIFVMRMM